jgi:ABC-type bacteriocin/lantibiotic exporter with double-glycine peptidase domain
VADISTSARTVQSLRRNLRARFRRWTIVRQFERTDCGPATLLTVLRHYGGDASLSEVRSACRTGTQGTTLLDLATAAQSFGFDASGVSGTLEELASCRLPCIAHVVSSMQMDHYVVVYAITDSRVIVADPAEGIRRLSRDAFTSMWQSGVILLLEPATQLHRAEQPSTWDWLRQHTAASEVLLTQAVFTGVLYTLLGLCTAYGIQQLIDTVIPRGQLPAVFVVGLGLLLLQVMRAAVGLWRARFLAQATARVTSSIGSSFIERILQLPASFYEGKNRGDFTSRLQDTLQIQGTLTRAFGSGIIDLVLVVGSLSYLAVLMPRLTLGIAGLSLIGAVAFYRAMRPMENRQRRVMHSYSETESRFIDTLLGVQEVVAFGAGAFFSARLKTLYQIYQSTVRDLNLHQALVLQWAEGLGGTFVVAVLVGAAALVLRHDLMIGEMVAAFSLVAQVIPALARLADFTITVQGAQLSTSRLLDIGGSSTLQDAQVPRMQRGHDAGVVLDNVGFSWPTGVTLFSSISLSLEPGTLVSLGGPNGSGKSTLAALIGGQLQPTDGLVRIAGDPTMPVERRESIVLRDETQVFSASLLENLTLGRTEIDEDRVMRLAEQLGVTDRLSRRGIRLTTLIGERGHRLSAGERQLVSLMRALLARPTVLVVDEGLNALDLTALEVVVPVLRDYARTHVVVVISHRPDVLDVADRRLWLDNGELVDNSHTTGALVQASGSRTVYRSAREKPWAPR